jgi:hypothetical protein
MRIILQPRSVLVGLSLCVPLLLSCSPGDAEEGIVEGPIGEKLDTYLSRLVPFGYSGVREARE